MMVAVVESVAVVDAVSDDRGYGRHGGFDP